MSEGFVVDWTIRAGDVLSFMGFAGGGLSVVLMMKIAIEKLVLRVKFLEDTVSNQGNELKKIAELITLVARYEEKIVFLQQLITDCRRDIEELRRGRGIIKD